MRTMPYVVRDQGGEVLARLAGLEDACVLVTYSPNALRLEYCGQVVYRRNEIAPGIAPVHVKAVVSGRVSSIHSRLQLVRAAVLGGKAVS